MTVLVIIVKSLALKKGMSIFEKTVKLITSLVHCTVLPLTQALTEQMIYTPISQNIKTTDR